MSCGAIRLLIYTISHSLEVPALHSGAICPLAGVTHRTPNLGIILDFSLLWTCVQQSCEQEWPLVSSAPLLSKLQAIPIKQHNGIVLRDRLMDLTFPQGPPRHIQKHCKPCIVGFILLLYTFASCPKNPSLSEMSWSKYK